MLQMIPAFIILTAVIFYGAMLAPAAPTLPRPTHIMLFEYISGIFQGDLGMSARFRRPVISLVSGALPYTAILTFGSISVASVLGVFLGIVAAVKQNKLTDNIIMVFSLIFSSIPIFFLAVLLMLVFSLYLGLLPSRGLDGWQGMIMPIMTLALPSVGFIARTTRAAMLEVLTMDSIKAARARGISERSVIFSHGLRNIQLPVITAIALRLAELLSGAVLVELAFSIPGIGRLVQQALIDRDLYLMMGCIVVLAFAFMIINLLVDLIYIIVDPRTKKSLR